MIIKAIVDETKYEYYESLSGDTALAVNGVQLIRMSKKLFLNEVDGERQTYAVIGNRCIGYSLVSNDEDKIPLSRNAWFDWALLAMPLLGIFTGVFFGMMGGILSFILNVLSIVINGYLIRSGLSLGKRILLSVALFLLLNAAWVGILAAYLGGFGNITFRLF